MKLLSQLGKYFLSGYFAAIASAASLISFIIYFIKEPWAIIFAISLFTLFLLGVFIKFILILNTFLSSKTSEGYLKFATYLRYSTLDGIHIHYELHKYIQCKRLIMDAHHHDFFWTGSKAGVISSTQQQYVKTIPPANDANLFQAVLKFKKPLIYNEVAIVEFIMDMDDFDHTSKKHCGQTVKENIHLISFVIELKHLKQCKDARMCRRVLNTDYPRDDENFDYVPFDVKSRSFHYNLFNPEPGYNYRIDWS
jgi:hypothetical protein